MFRPFPTHCVQNSEIEEVAPLLEAVGTTPGGRP